MTTIKSFSSDIQGHIETYDESLNSSSPTDAFQINPIIRRRLYGQWMLVETGEGLEAGYKRVKDSLKVESKKADEAAENVFAGKKITDRQKQILVVGWPKIFKKIFPKVVVSKNSENSENLQNKSFQDQNFQDQNFQNQNFQDQNFQDQNFQDQNFQDQNFQNPESTRKAKEFNWTEWEKAIPRDENGKIDPKILNEEKRAFEEYWRDLLEVMKKMWIPGKSWGTKSGEYYHRDVGWY